MLVFTVLHFEIRLDFTERSYYLRKLVLANARSGKTVPTRGSRAGPTTHPHSRIKHKCHLPMPDTHEPRASLLFPLRLLFLLSETPRAFFPAALPSRISKPLLTPLPALVAMSVNFLVAIFSQIFFFGYLISIKKNARNSSALQYGMYPLIQHNKGLFFDAI